MLKINLLPPHINEGSKRPKVAAFYAVVWAAVAFGFIYWAGALNAEADRIQKLTDEAIPHQQKYQEYVRLKTEVDNAAAAVKAKYQFAKSADEHLLNTYPQLVRHIRNYTIRSVVYSDMTPSGNTVTMNAWAPSIAEVGKYLMWMEHNPNISNVSVSMTSLPSVGVDQVFPGPAGTGIRPPSGSGHNFVVRLTLVNPIPGPPAYAPGGGGQGAQGGGAGTLGGGGGGATPTFGGTGGRIQI